MSLIKELDELVQAEANQRGDEVLYRLYVKTESLELLTESNKRTQEYLDRYTKLKIELHRLKKNHYHLYDEYDRDYSRSEYDVEKYKKQYNDLFSKIEEARRNYYAAKNGK